MDWQTIGAVAGAVTAVLGAVAAVTGQLGKAWAAGRQWQLRRKKSLAGDAPRAPAPSTERASSPSLGRGQALRNGPAVVWIIYRREDAAGTAQQLHDALSRRLGTKNVRMDPGPDDGPPGGTESHREMVRRTDFALVLMGPEWLRSEDENARRRLWSPDDPVRRRIAAALAAGAGVVPILVRGALMPGPDQLPQEISSLTRRNALQVTQTCWESDVDRVAELFERWA